MKGRLCPQRVILKVLCMLSLLYFGPVCMHVCHLLLLFSPSMILQFCDRRIYCKSCNFRKSSQIFIIAEKFPQILGLDTSRDVIATRIQSKKRLFLSLKKLNEQPAFSSCPISKSYIGQTNRKRKESALLVWATNCLSAWAGATGCSRSRDTVIHSQVT